MYAKGVTRGQATCRWPVERPPLRFEYLSNAISSVIVDSAKRGLLPNGARIRKGALCTNVTTGL